MLDSAKRLKLILEHCQISNKELAQELKVDSSQVSRWVNGERPLRLSSVYLEAITDVLLKSCKRMDALTWLRYQLHLDGFVTCESNDAELKKYLTVWLSCDGMATMQKLGRVEPRFGITIPAEPSDVEREPLVYQDVCSVLHGIVNIVTWLETMLQKVPVKENIDIFLSNENAPFLTEPAVVQSIIKTVFEKKLHVRMLLFISANTFALSNIITEYLSVIAISNLELFVVHGADQSILCQTTILIPNECVGSVMELPGKFTRPTLTINSDRAFLQATFANFDRVAHYAQPLFKSFSDNNTRSIMEIFISEYTEGCTLDVLKNGLNPMFMTLSAYNDMLVKNGYKGNALDWRNGEYKMLKNEFERNMRAGTMFREILSAEKLEQIVCNQSCCLPNVYLMGTGMVTIDAESCKAILLGYIEYLTRFPSFHLFIMDRIPALSDNSCWHIKQNRHIAISAWNSDSPTFMYSDQLILTYDYQRRFNEYWIQGNNSQGLREKTISQLEQYALLLKP